MERTTAGRGTGRLGRRGTAILALACAAEFMVVLDVSVVNVALPSVQRDLGVSDASLQWVVNAYALTFAGLLLLGGRLSDLFGRRRVFVAGLAVFSVTSLVGGAATSSGVLLAARAGQGVGAAILAPATLTLLTTTFPEGASRTRALALWTAVGLAGGTAGNLLGGAITEVLSWRWILLINVPIGVVAVAATLRLLDRDVVGGRSGRLDVPGALTATFGLAAVTFGITQTEARGWGDPVTIATVAGGITLLALFVALQARTGTGSPLLPLRLFRVRSLAVGNVVMVLAGAALMPMWVFLTLALQRVLGYSALETGLAFLPHTLVTMLVAARLTPRLMAVVDGRALVVGGALLAAAGFAWQSTLGPGSTYLSGVLGPAIVLSLGAGLLITPATTATTAQVNARYAGAASGLMNTAKQVGGVLGLAVLTAVAGTGAASREGLADEYAAAFLAIAGVLVLTALVALALPGGRGGGGARSPS